MIFGLVRFVTHNAVWLILSLMAVPVLAQPTWEEDQARQQADWQRQQENHRLMDEAAAESAEEDYQEERRTYMPPPPLHAESHMAVAWNFDTSEVWASSGHRTGEEAVQTVLAACNQAMGSGCMIGAHWVNNSFIAVVHDDFGIPWIRGGARLSLVAESDAMEDCRKHSVGCRLTMVFNESPLPLSSPPGLDLSDKHFPVGPIRRHTFAMVAWPEKEPPDAWSGIVWLSTGERNWREAKDKLLAKCQSDSGVPCTMGTTVANGVLVRYVNENGVTFWVGVRSAAVATARINSLCAIGSHCWVVDTVDTASPRFTTLNEAKIAAPGRGFFAFAWAAKWPKAAIVTGRSTNAAALAAAIKLCTEQSKEKCVPYFDDGDRGNGRYLAVYRDSIGNIRTYIGFSPDELEYRAKAACAKANVICTQRAMVDLSRTAVLTPDI